MHDWDFAWRLLEADLLCALDFARFLVKAKAHDAPDSKPGRCFPSDPTHTNPTRTLPGLLREAVGVIKGRSFRFRR